VTWLSILLGYLLGSFPTAYLAGHIVAGKDIRRMGDENMGAANAYRTLGPAAGLGVFFIDVAKGALAVFLAQKLTDSQVSVILTGAAAVAGHNWPFFLGFRGGRGESTAIGVLLVVYTIPTLVMALPAILTLAISRNVILTSAVLFVPLSLIGYVIHLPGLLIGYSIGLPCLVGLTHYLRTRKQPATGH